MKFQKQVWDQLKNLTADQLIAALRRDRWKLESSKGSIQIYRHTRGGRVSIHYHAQKTFGAKLLRALLDDIGWSIADLKRLKLIK